MKKKDIEFDAEALVGSVESMAAHVRGERKLTMRIKTMTLPEPIAPIRPRDVAAIRRKLHVSQSVFAALLNVPKVTAISWEKGRRKPSGAALRLLDLIRKKPTFLRRLMRQDQKPRVRGRKLTGKKRGSCREDRQPV
jgi:putative transcriptional regulator